MPKICVLYDDRECTGCGECERCDLDPQKICDNCGKCIDGDADAEFRSVKLKGYEDTMKKFDEDAINSFLDEPISLETPADISIDPELAAKWERILAESLKNDPICEADEEATVLRAVRKRREHRNRRGSTTTL